MFVYWLMFIIPAWLAVIKRNPLPIKPLNQLWWMLAILLTLIIGYRYQVGGDWFTYLLVYNEIDRLAFQQAIARTDLGYVVLNKISQFFGWGIYGVNIISGALFSWGLVLFCRYQRNSFLALTVAIPYLVIIVAMGYTRQGTAIGLVMLGILGFSQNKIWQFIIFVMMAALFHKSALFLIPLAMLTKTQNKWLLYSFTIALLAMIVSIFKQDADTFVNHYIKDTYYHSDGAMIRVLMNLIPATGYLLYRNKLNVSIYEIKLWTFISWGSVVLFGLLVLFPDQSTPIDRISLYFIPIQIIFFSKIPILAKTEKNKNALKASVAFYYAAVLFVWLHYANTAFAWLPYRFYLLEII